MGTEVFALKKKRKEKRTSGHKYEIARSMRLGRLRATLHSSRLVAETAEDTPPCWSRLRIEPSPEPFLLAGLLKNVTVRCARFAQYPFRLISLLSAAARIFASGVA